LDAFLRVIFLHYFSRYANFDNREKSYPRYFPLKKIETIQKELKYDKTPPEFVQRLEKKIQSEIAKRYAYWFFREILTTF